MNDYRKMYFRNWGDAGGYSEFPYEIAGVNMLPPNNVSANDVDLDAYTNTAGYTVRNRTRDNVASIEFQVPTMTGDELHKLFQRTTDIWLDCKFFYEPAWAFVSKKMYRSGTIKYTKYYVDENDPNENIYTDVTFSLIEE